MTDSEPAADYERPGQLGDHIAGALQPAGRSLFSRLHSALQLAGHAERELWRRKRILLVVVGLTLFASLSGLIARDITSRRLQRDSRYAEALRREGPPATLAQRYARGYRGRLSGPVLLESLTAYASPLGAPSSVFSPWFSVLASTMFPTRPGTPFSNARLTAAILLLGVPISALSLLLAVGLLGWLRDADRRSTFGDWPHYWKAHFGPLFALACLLVGWSAVFQLLLPSLQDLPFGHVAWMLAVFGPGIALMLVPFAVVGRGLGLRQGVIQGLRLLRERWLTLLVLFVIYRIGYELLAIAAVLPPSPWPQSPVTPHTPAPALLECFFRLARAVLGLWVAYAFMELVRIPQPPAAPQSEGA